MPAEDIANSLRMELRKAPGLIYRVVDWLEVPVEIKEVFWDERKKSVNWGMQEFWEAEIL